jgi:outer membrane protein assembly factor BamB
MAWVRRKPVVQLAGLLAVASLLSGCWLQIGGGPEHSYFNAGETKLTSTNVGRLQETWRTGGVTFASEVVVSGGRAYVSDIVNFASTMQARITAMDVRTGATLWEVAVGETRETVQVSPVVVVGGEVWVSYVASNRVVCDAGLLRFDAISGAIRGQVFDGYTSAVVPFGDKVAWTGYRDQGDICGSQPHKLWVAESDTGFVDWTAPVHGLPLPVVVGPRIVVDGRAYDVDGCGQDECEAVWEAAIGAPVRSALGSSDGHIFATSETGKVVSLDPATGQVLWSSSLPEPLVAASSAVADGLLYVADSGTNPSTLHVFAVVGCGAATCEPVWSASSFSAIGGGPVVAGGIVYVSSDPGLRAYLADGCGTPTCSPVFELSSGAGPLSVSDGTLFMSDGASQGTGWVVAYTAPA